MTASEPSQDGTQALNWNKARRCDTNTCVEVAGSPEALTVFVRNSQDPGGSIVSFPAEDWDAWVDEVRAGKHQESAWGKL